METVFQLREAVEPYGHVMDHLSDELLKLDVILDIEMQRMNVPVQDSTGLETFRGMFMSEAEARHLLGDQRQWVEFSQQQLMLIEQMEQLISARVAASQEHYIRLPLLTLQHLFQLTEIDMRMLIVAIAPHVNRKYLKLYAYLQDDMTCQYITLDLLLKLCCRNEEEHRVALTKLTKRSSFMRTFFTSQEIAGSQEASLLTQPIRLDERMLYYILGWDWRFEGLLSRIQLYPRDKEADLPPFILHEDIHHTLQQFTEQTMDKGHTVMLLLHGPSGSGKTFHARHLCKSLDKALLEWDIHNAPNEEQPFKAAVDTLLREAKLNHAVPAFHRVDQLYSSDPQSDGKDQRRKWLMDQLLAWKDIVFLFGEEAFRPVMGPESPTALLIQPLETPSIETRRQLWKSLSGDTVALTDAETSVLAGKFRFTPGKITATLKAWHQQLERKQMLTGASMTRTETIQLLHRTAYQLIDHRIKDKAVKMESKFAWEDLILPPETIQLLRQASDRLRFQYTVMHQWGFDRKLAYGKGLSMLFTGPPGTGKTMSAMVIAKELNLELYRIDLSRIVSKYIGETEKHLSDIFDQAKESGAILFFDEADALFGKRSEVKDAHDKYANMETSYLLQKMEEYEGLTILATNFAQNLDDAFTRRIQFIIKYPFPDPIQREELWRYSFPSELPVEAIDYEYLAKTFELAGGPIKNVVLTAAYLAANEGGPVSMKHLIEGVVQEYKKTGKVLLKDRLGVYADLWKG